MQMHTINGNTDLKSLCLNNNIKTTKILNQKYYGN